MDGQRQNGRNGWFDRLTTDEMDEVDRERNRNLSNGFVKVYEKRCLTYSVEKLKNLSPLRGLRKKRSLSLRGLPSSPRLRRTGTPPGYETCDPFRV
jgi:hypothetical protein